MSSEKKESGYRIWGADNVVYGPVDAPSLKKWAEDERITPDTWVFENGLERWCKAVDVSVLAGFFKSKTSSEDSEQNKTHSGIRPGTLRRIKILGGMRDDQLAGFVRFMEVVEVNQFQEVVKKGQQGDSMYLVLEGEVRARVMIDGRESTLATLSTGDFFGEIAVFDQGPRSADIVANSSSVLLKISAKSLADLVDTVPELASAFLYSITGSIASRLRKTSKKYQDSIHFSRMTGRTGM
ncbi:MAG TPA: cyclic nucleotide-binding domain-containing protein [Verrucomicrobiales bacterium]|nr:cyclic nucleotide-binding domain-containing protein [Verrucomicrobiales bacterium]